MRFSTIISISFILFLLLPGVYAQEFKEEKLAPPAYVEWDRFSTTNQLTLYNLNSDNYKGTPFLYDNFVKGTVYFNNLKKVSDVSINYNINTGEVIYLDEGQTYLMYTKDVLYFTVNEKDKSDTLIFRHEFVPHARRLEFLQILNEGETILFKRRIKEFKEGEHKNPYSAGGQVDEYVDKKEYLVKHDNEVKLLKPRKKAILELFSDHATKLGIFMKEEKINLRLENDLIRLVDYYSELE